MTQASSERLGVLRPVILLTLLFEATTVLLRYGCGLESTRDTASTIGVVTMGLRIHHGYLGVLFCLLAIWIGARRGRRVRWLWILGLSLLLSDAVHHFLVLWPIEGSPEFHLWYH